MYTEELIFTYGALEVVRAREELLTRCRALYNKSVGHRQELTYAYIHIYTYLYAYICI